MVWIVLGVFIGGFFTGILFMALLFVAKERGSYSFETDDESADLSIPLSQWVEWRKMATDDRMLKEPGEGGEFKRADF